MKTTTKQQSPLQLCSLIIGLLSFARVLLECKAQHKSCHAYTQHACQGFCMAGYGLSQRFKW